MIEKNIVKIEPVRVTRTDIKATLRQIPLGKTAHFYCRELCDVNNLRQHRTMLKQKEGMMYDIEVVNFGEEFYITRTK